MAQPKGQWRVSLNARGIYFVGGMVSEVCFFLSCLEKSMGQIENRDRCVCDKYMPFGVLMLDVVHDEHFQLCYHTEIVCATLKLKLQNALLGLVRNSLKLCSLNLTGRFALGDIQTAFCDLVHNSANPCPLVWEIPYILVHFDLFSYVYALSRLKSLSQPIKALRRPIYTACKALLWSEMPSHFPQIYEYITRYFKQFTEIKSIGYIPPKQSWPF